MKLQNKACTAFALWAAMGAALAWAPGDEIVPPPQPQRYDNVEVINGGASIEEADAIKRVAPQYNLRVEISGRGGQYFVADRVQLIQRGTVLAEIPDAGPWLLLDVPAGRYTLRGEFGNTEVRRDVTVPASGTTVHWVVPSNLN